MKKKTLLFVLLMALFAPLAMNAQQALPYGYSFEDNDLTTDGWTTSNLSNGGILQLYNSGPHYRVFGFNYTSNPPQYLISPELTGTEYGVNVEFQYAIYNTNYGVETFQVGYSTTTNATSSFTWDAEVTASNALASGGSWLTYSKTYPAGTKYVAVKHTSNDVLYLFVDEFTFTAPDPCGTPTELTSTVTPTTATLSWTSIQDSYTVRYRTAPSVDFFEGFEEGIPSTWTLIDNDGDGNNWTASTAGAYEGSYCATSASYSGSALTPDNWLCTPQIALNGEMKVWLRAQDPEWPDEHFAIYLTTADSPTVRNFTRGTTLVAETVATGEYVEYTYDLSSYNGQMGYIGIRHFNCTDMFRLNVDNFGLYGAVVPAGAWQTASVNGTTTTINGLTAETSYEWQVQGNCASGTTDWSARASFTTPSACDTPNSLAVTDITDNSAVLSWTGYQNSYTIQYAPLELAYEADLTNGIPSGWTTNDADGDGNNWDVETLNTGETVVYSASYINDVGALTPDNWLITSEMTMGSMLYVTAYGIDPSYAAEHFAVYYSARGTDPSNFTQISDEFVATGNATAYAVDLSNYAGRTGYIAIRHFNVTDMYQLVLSGFEMYNTGTPVTVQNVTTTSYTMENLAANTTYMVQVKGTCTNGETDWSEACIFTTISGNVFVNDGDWNVARNWFYGEVPAEGADVVINANATIPADYTAIAGAITIGENGSLTIQDGGQLIHTNNGVIATVEKKITGYKSDRDNYYLISTPVYDKDIYDNYGEDYQLALPEDVNNMLENDYDLYDFDFTAELEWLNYENDEFYLWKNYGYLYANSEDVTLQFTGALTPAPITSLDPLTGYYLPYTEDEYTFANWNMWGNPYPCNTYIWVYDITNDDYYSFDHYKLNGEEFIESDDPFTPAEGGFFISEGASQYALVAIAEAAFGEKKFGRSLSLNLTQNGNLIDAARIRFGEGNGLKKFQLNPNHTKIYMPVNGNDYAVVYTETQGEMPVSFRAAENGNYTLSFNTENVELGYLHLIDNMTGKDVDLLSTPSYSFEAKTTDYASRFKLVFATGNADDSFAFFSNGSFVINNEGNATLQVVDVTGRIIKSESINGCANVNVNAAPGVYMIRLVNGENVKVQKVVVR